MEIARILLKSLLDELQKDPKGAQDRQQKNRDMQKELEKLIQEQEREAKASEDREVQANGGIDQEDWHNIGLDETVAVTKDWKDYTFTITVSEPVANNNRIGFALGQAKGKVWFKDVTLTAK